MKKPLLLLCAAALCLQAAQAQTPGLPRSAATKTSAASTSLYENKRLALSFRYPATWKKDATETEQRNLKDEPVTVGIGFRDSLSGASLRLEYYLQPDGRSIYQSALAAAGKTGSHRRTLSDEPAVETVRRLTENGRGEALPEQLELRIVDAPDRRSGRNLRLLFQYPIAQRAEALRQFEELLASFRFGSH